MKALTGGTPKPDTTAVKKQQQLLEQQEARVRQQEADQLLDEEERKKRDAASSRAKRGRSGRESLLSGLETGITPVQDGRRQVLG